MRLLRSLEHSLRDYTFISSSDTSYPRSFPSPSYTNNGLFPKFLQVTLPCDGECFIPAILASKMSNIITERFESVTPAEPIQVSIPLFVSSIYLCRSADKILQAINSLPENYRLVNIKTPKGLNYYGGNGVILDENWNPMILAGYYIKIDGTRTETKIVSPVYCVDPRVFEENDILSKAIIKKVIPYLSTGMVHTPFMYPNGIPVIIQPLDKFFYTPEKPMNIENLDDDIWDCLNRNIKDLV